MAVDIIDSVGATIWPGDNCTCPAGACSVVAILESDDSLSDQVVVNVSGTQYMYTPSAITITARGSELPSNLDQAQPGVAD